jgi:hypothetical protein
LVTSALLVILAYVLSYDNSGDKRANTNTNTHTNTHTQTHTHTGSISYSSSSSLSVAASALIFIACSPFVIRAERIRRECRCAYDILNGPETLDSGLDLVASSTKCHPLLSANLDASGTTTSTEKFFFALISL